MTGPLRIAYVIPYYVPALSFGGPVTVCSQLAEDMARRGHEVTVLTTDAASRRGRVPVLRERVGSVEVVRVRNLSQRLVRQNLFAPLGFASAADRVLNGADVVHVHEFFTWLTYRAVERAAARSLPVLLTAHGGLSLAAARGRAAVKRALMSLLGRRTLARCQAIQVMTDAEAESCLALGVPRDKLRLIPNGVATPLRPGDGARFRARFGVDGRPIVLYVGRLRAGKGVDLLLDVAARFAPDGPVFVLAGPAENRVDLTPGWRGPNVLLTGLLTGDELEDAYRAASIFTLPSFAEGLPVTALEALAFGVPCLLSRACNLDDVAKVGAGLIVEPSADALGHGLKDLLSQPERWPAMRQAALGLASQRYQLSRVHDQLEELYREIGRAC